jgi:site-specific DNA-adenine methylase
MLLPSLLQAATEPLLKTIWGSPAGKKRLAARLVKLIPPHKTYVEPFAGSAAVFFEKEPAETEVLSDADPEIALAFKAIKSLSDRELKTLQGKNWVGRATTFKELAASNPRGKVEKLYRFLYLSHFAYGKLRGKSFNPGAEGTEARTTDRIETVRHRLANATVRHAHYADVVKEYDGKSTFFFLDPPYPGHNVEVGEDKFDEAEFRKVLEGIKGKFLVTYGTRGELETKGFHVKRINPPRSIRTMHGVGGPKVLPTLLISNYTIAEKSLGRTGDSWRLDDIETEILLSAEAADDLERARLLSKALAAANDVPELAELAAELKRIQSPAEERAAVLAGDLLKVLGGLATSMHELPAIGAAIEEATPALEKLAKAQWSRAFVNDLPDSAFLYIEPGHEKDEAGKTTPRSARHFPYRNRNGDLDVPHLRNAIARIPQSTAPGLTADRKDQLQARAHQLLEEAQADLADVEKAKLIPFQQWGGSAKYARKLAERLPKHRRYVEPFCGAAAVFYAKPPADEEVLADADPEVAFAHRFLQKLDESAFAALERLPWRVSRTGFERVRACEPKSDAERFWKIAYGRLCTWGAKPNLSGFATIHDGQTYDLDDLWRFHERLKGVRILTQDWHKTLADHDAPGTLFFIDPPYAEEWAVGDGISPEEVAKAVAKLRGDYIIAYTDSAKARRALARAGRPFKMSIPEGRSAGQWQKRSRLFVASAKLQKTEDLAWVEEPPSEAITKAISSALSKRIPLLKTEEERFVFGVVLEPETVDAQEDIYSAEDVRGAAHRFMEGYQNIGYMHRQLVNSGVKILESYLAPADFDTPGGHVKKGTWVLAVRVEDDDLWRQVKAGEISGFSIGGTAISEPEAA